MRRWVSAFTLILLGGASVAGQNANLSVRDAGTAFELTVPVSALTLTIPKGELTQNPANPANGPRYFFFSDKTGLSISGWFEPAQAFTGMKSFWEQEVAAAKKNGLPEAADVAFEQIGKWDTVIYDLTIPAGRNVHIRAHWVASGTWVDVHLSVAAAEESSSALRTRLRDTLKTLQVTEKPASQIVSTTTPPAGVVPGANVPPMKVEKAATDPEYGFTQAKPVKVGHDGFQKGVQHTYAFLNALAGPNGEKLAYRRAGACCPFETKNGAVGGGGLLDVYLITWEGGKELRLYVNVYDPGDILIPVGLTAKKF
jgi:hypothetical protein